MKIDWRTLRATASELAKAGVKGASQAAVELKGKADNAANVVAAKFTEMTGRETSPDEVKKAAVIAAGVAVLGAVSLSLVAASSGDVIATAASAGGDGWGSDFESQATKSFAELGGSLNFYTPHVDSCGTVYSGQY